jgi:DNA-binding transcriptional LysR family regulator
MFVTGLPTSDGRQQVRSPVNVWGRDGRLIVEPLLVQRLYFACRPDHPLTEEASPTIERALEFPLVAALLRGEHAVLATGDAKAGDFTPQILVNSTSLSRLIARECDVLFPATAAMIADDVAAG